MKVPEVEQTLVRDVAVLRTHVRAARSGCPRVHTFQCRGQEKRSHNMLGARHQAPCTLLHRLTTSLGTQGRTVGVEVGAKEFERRCARTRVGWRVCAATRARDAPPATLVRDVAVLCAHVRAAHSCRGPERRSHNMLGARHQAPSSLRACDRLPTARLQPLDAFAGGFEGSPLLPCDTTQTDAARSTRNPADRAVGETSRRCDVSFETRSEPAGVGVCSWQISRGPRGVEASRSLHARTRSVHLLGSRAHETGSVPSSHVSTGKATQV